MKLAKFKPWLDVDSIAAELNECGDPMSFKASNERRELKDITEAIIKVESIDPCAMWTHPFFVCFKTIRHGWIVVAIDKVYYSDDSFGDDTTTAYAHEEDTKLIAD